MTTTHTEQSMETYLSALRAALGPITVTERDDILREIGAHIRDSVEAGTPVETVLARLGTAEQLASEYRDGLLVHRASRSLSPLLLLRATLRLASKGVAGVLVYTFGFFGYITGICLFMMGLLKPFMPHSTGMWVTKSATVSQSTPMSPSNGQLMLFGVRSMHLDASSHEVLGWWAIPLGLIGGAIILVVTTVLIRLFLRTSRTLQARLAGDR